MAPTTARPKLKPDRVEIAEFDPSERNRGFQEILLPYTAEEAIEEAQRCIQCAKPWCVEACPIAQDCREYLRLIAEGDFDTAYEVILRDNPLASSLGRICYNYCEEACVIGKKGDPVAIRHLKRAAQDFSDVEGTYRPKEPDGLGVAVVGAGPAGLMAAWVLAGKGYAVTIYEADDKLGGLVTQTIPEYRLPRDAWRDDMDRMEKLGIRFILGVRMGDEVTLDQLREEYDAVFLGIGTHMPYRMSIPGEDLEGVHHALDFLKTIIGEGKDVSVGRRVAVIGGGDVAMDSARTAVRLKSEEVTVVYRRSRQEMPASDQEIKEAKDEGVDFKFLTAPVKILGEDKVEAMDCIEMELGEPDDSGRRRPVPVEGSEFTIEVDTVLIAIGQAADLVGLPEGIGITKGKGGVIVSDDETGATELPGVYVGGGVSVVHAMAAGKKAAHAIDEYLAPSAVAAAPG